MFAVFLNNLLTRKRFTIQIKTKESDIIIVDDRMH
jgi:hypothetical protein